jgi:L-ascorbate metabolism protein UlaG (beta-lactamase superfamily)
MRAATLLLLCSCSLFSTRGYQGPKSDHFDGEEFFNPDVGTSKENSGFFDFIGWMLTRDRGEWPDPFHAEPGPKPPERVARGELRITFVNHATLLIQMDGLNILTDPIWSDVAGPTPATGVERFRPPGLRFEDLPPIDLVLISHNHYDHCDLPTLARLMERFTPRIAAGLGTSEFLRSHGIRNARDFDWWSSQTIAPGVRLTSVPVQHFSGRGLFDVDETLWTGFVISGPSGNVYFAGDTGYGPHFAEVGRRFGPIRVAVLPIGAYRPRWFMQEVHIDPSEAVKAHVDLRAKTSVGMHFGTFRQADDGFTEPVDDLKKARERAGLAEDDFIVLVEGEGRAEWD